MTCEACRHSLAEQSADSALPTAVAEHIAGCPACAAVLVQERHVRAVLASAPWPSSSMAGDLQRLNTYATAQEADRLLHRRQQVRWWAVGLGLLAAVGWLSVWIARLPTETLGIGRLGWLKTALIIGIGLAAWTWLDVVGRRLATSGAVASMQLGIGLGRAAVGLAIVVAIIEPSRLMELPYAISRLAGGPAEAHGGVVEAELLCAAGDGRLHLARASQGCRGHEVEVTFNGGAVRDGAETTNDLAIRFGTATIPAGASGLTVNFKPSMSNGSYQVLFTPHNANKPITTDDACHVIGIGGKSTSHFNLDIRRCWYEGTEVPHTWAASDITVDWVVIGGR